MVRNLGISRLGVSLRSGWDKRRPYYFGLFCLWFTAIGWGIGWPIMKSLIYEMPPLTARGSTGLLGGIILMVLASINGQSLRVNKSELLKLALLGLLNVGCWLSFMGLSLWWLSAAEGVVIAYTMPVWTSVLAWPVLGERLSWQRAAALLIAVSGVAALAGAGPIEARWDRMPGIMLALAGAVAFAVGAVLTKRAALSVPPLVSTAWQLMFGCFPVLAIGLLSEQTNLAAISSQGWLSLAYYAVIGFGICYLTWFAALERLPASVASIGTLMVPVVGVVISALVMHEPIATDQLFAFGAILSGIVLASRSAARQ